MSKQQDRVLWVTMMQHYHSGEGQWDKQLVSESWRNQGRHIIHLIFSMSDDVKRENVGDSTVVFNRHGNVLPMLVYIPYVCCASSSCFPVTGT